MFDRQFWTSQLGQAATASILAMTAMIALTTQLQASPASFTTLAEHSAAIEMA
ncbi:MAG: hypothetical protein AAF127_10620 [Pseudomonadota bacterium]